MPLLSIITINYNNKSGLEKTVNSVLCQTYKDFEYIVIDGGSTDRSAEYIKEKQDYFDYWVSEPDSGIYNAMNKGVKQANGKYLLFLNSGDWLLDRQALQNALKSHSFSEDIIYFNKKTLSSLVKYPKEIDLLFLITKSICHQATFIKRELFSQIGLYDESLKIVADWKFWLISFVINKCSHTHIDDQITLFDVTGIGTDKSYLNTKLKERDKVLTELFNLDTSHFQSIINNKTELEYYTNSKYVKVVKKIESSRLFKNLQKLLG